MTPTNPTDRLREIFTEHCNLSTEQFEEISGRLIDIDQGIRELSEGEENQVELESEFNELGVIFEFLYNTKKLKAGEYNDLCNMVGEMYDEALSAVTARED